MAKVLSMSEWGVMDACCTCCNWGRLPSSSALIALIAWMRLFHVLLLNASLFAPMNQSLGTE